MIPPNARVDVTGAGSGLGAQVVAADLALHITPQLDGRWAWRLKRMAPTAFERLSRRVASVMVGR